MLITYPAFKYPNSTFNLPDSSWWSVAELAHHQPWYVVQFTDVKPTSNGKNESYLRNLIVTELEDLDLLKASQIKGQSEIRSVLIVTPGNINGSNNWKMEPLEAVWLMKRPSLFGECTEVVYETSSGETYPRLGETIPPFFKQEVLFRLDSEAVKSLL